jgi:hypothetical protein
MESFINKHADKIVGTLNCFDRVLFRGYLPLMSGFAMAKFLKSRNVRRAELKPFLLEQAARLKSHAQATAAKSIPPVNGWLGVAAQGRLPPIADFNRS